MMIGRSVLNYEGISPATFYQANIDCLLPVDQSGNSSPLHWSVSELLNSNSLTSSNRNPILPIFDPSMPTVYDLECSLAGNLNDSSADTISNLSLVLNWKTTGQDYFVSGYKIRFWKSGEAVPNEIFIANASQESISLDTTFNFEPANQNQCVMFAIQTIFREKRYSNYTANKTCKVQVELPEPPAKIDLSILNATTEYITFNQQDNHYCDVTGISTSQKTTVIGGKLRYKVRFWRKGEKNWTEAVLANQNDPSTDTVALILSGLEPGNSHWLNIAAQDAIGRWGSFSNNCSFNIPTASEINFLAIVFCNNIRKDSTPPNDLGVFKTKKPNVVVEKVSYMTGILIGCSIVLTALIICALVWLKKKKNDHIGGRSKLRSGHLFASVMGQRTGAKRRHSSVNCQFTVAQPEILTINVNPPKLSNDVECVPILANGKPNESHQLTSLGGQGGDPELAVVHEMSTPLLSNGILLDKSNVNDNVENDAHRFK